MSELPVPYFKQDTNYTCGPTSLQMVLAYYDFKDSEKNLAELLNTNKDTGTRRVDMHKLATELGFHCYVNDNAALPEIDFLLQLKVPPIVRFIEPDNNEDHYGVIIGMTDDDVVIHDPWNGPSCHFSKEDFQKRWTCDVIGDCDQWLMGISPEPIPLGKQFHPHE